MHLVTPPMLIMSLLGMQNRQAMNTVRIEGGRRLRVEDGG